MIIDLRMDAPPTTLTSDVCVVGAGTVGCLFAAALVERGLDVVVVEAGGRSVVDGAHHDWQPGVVGMRYGGVHEGRGFGLGGTSALWGGVLVPLGALDVQAASTDDRQTWGRIADAVREHAAEVRRAVGIDRAPRFEEIPRDFLGSMVDDVGAAGLRTLGSEMLPFPMRNFARLLPANPSRGRLRVLLNAPVIDWTFDRTSDRCRATSLGAGVPDGRRVRVDARQFAVTAGTVESTRILLEMDRLTDGRVLDGRNDLGSFLSDHLSTPIAEFHGDAATKAIGLFAQRFAGRVLHAIRFIDEDILRAGVRHFAHISFASDNPGFLLAKKVLSAVQAKRMPSFSLNEIGAGLGGLAALAFHRYVTRRLYIAADTPVRLQLDVEQKPRRENAVRLRADRDRFGRWNVDVAWSVTADDAERMATVQQSLIAKWRASRSPWPAVEAIPLGTGSEKLHDTFHPVGTCRMGTDADAVLDLDLRVRGLANVWLLSTAALPSAGCANPTFSILCLAQAAAHSIAAGPRR